MLKLNWPKNVHVFGNPHNILLGVVWLEIQLYPLIVSRLVKNVGPINVQSENTNNIAHH